MSKEELEWITNRHEGEVMYFKTAEGKQDTVIICKIEVSNSLNPFNMSYFNTSNTEYIAGGCIDYRFNRTTSCEGVFYVQKTDNSKPLCFSGGLLERWSRFIALKQISLKINNATLNDIVFFDESNTEQIRDSAQENPIASYAWSKKHGLVQYTFKDGTSFTINSSRNYFISDKGDAKVSINRKLIRATGAIHTHPHAYGDLYPDNPLGISSADILNVASLFDNTIDILVVKTLYGIKSGVYRVGTAGNGLLYPNLIYSF